MNDLTTTTTALFPEIKDAIIAAFTTEGMVSNIIPLSRAINLTTTVATTKQPWLEYDAVLCKIFQSLELVLYTEVEGLPFLIFKTLGPANYTPITSDDIIQYVFPAEAPRNHIYSQVLIDEYFVQSLILYAGKAKSKKLDLEFLFKHKSTDLYTFTKFFKLFLDKVTEQGDNIEVMGKALKTILTPTVNPSPSDEVGQPTQPPVMEESSYNSIQDPVIQMSHFTTLHDLIHDITVKANKHFGISLSARVYGEIIGKYSETKLGLISVADVMDTLTTAQIYQLATAIGFQDRVFGDLENWIYTFLNSYHRTTQPDEEESLSSRKPRQETIEKLHQYRSDRPISRACERNRNSDDRFGRRRSERQYENEDGFGRR